MARIVSIVGRSGVGKTTYLESLLPELSRRGVRTAVVKHDAGGFEMDRPGKDTWRYARAGGTVVAISGPDRFALIEQRAAELSLDEIAARLPAVDLILTEGFKQSGRNRVELLRRDCSEEPVLATADLIAVLADFPVHAPLPRFPLDDPRPFADFLLPPPAPIG
jgi:molybdopterin-guanine dinucleotide biosynthesis protein B